MMEIDNKITGAWPGWAETAKNVQRTREIRQFGLEMQCPFAEHLLCGRKTIESRAYDLPAALLTKVVSDGTDAEVRIDILESEAGQDGVSAIPDEVAVIAVDCLDQQDTQPRPVLVRKGWCTFKESFRYTSRDQFEGDESKHLVPLDSGYGWDEKRPVYGWVVADRGFYKSADSGSKFIAKRRMRSLFEIQELKK
jgi:hypothetical protein